MAARDAKKLTIQTRRVGTWNTLFKTCVISHRSMALRHKPCIISLHKPFGETSLIVENGVHTEQRDLQTACHESYSGAVRRGENVSLSLVRC